MEVRTELTNLKLTQFTPDMELLLPQKIMFVLKLMELVRLMKQCVSILTVMLA